MVTCIIWWIVLAQIYCNENPEIYTEILKNDLQDIGFKHKSKLMDCPPYTREQEKPLSHYTLC